MRPFTIHDIICMKRTLLCFTHRDHRNEQKILAASRQFIAEATKNVKPVYGEHILIVQGLEVYNKSRQSALNATMNAVVAQGKRPPTGRSIVAIRSN